MYILHTLPLCGIISLALVGVISEAGPVGGRAGDGGHNNVEHNGQIKSRPARSRSRLSDSDCYDYLHVYGYQQGRYNLDYTSAIIRFQRYFGLYQSGYLDDQTREMMEKPRCGNYEPVHGASRKKRFAVSRFYLPANNSGWLLLAALFTFDVHPDYYVHYIFTIIAGGWNHNALTYTFRSYNEDLGRAKTEEIIRKAFNYWSEVTPLRFTKATFGSPADIEIIFARGVHHTSIYDVRFDGPRRTLAHAFYPNLGHTLSGDAHFDEDEDFTDGSPLGINLLQVAVHEFGHSLGLQHSSDRNAVMFATYPGYQSNFKLGTDDITGIQSIYGRNINGPQTSLPTASPTPPTVIPSTLPPPTSPPVRPPTGQPSPPLPTTSSSTITTTRITTTASPTFSGGDICTDGRVDAMASITDIYGQTHVLAFRGNYVMLLNDFGVLYGPQPLHHIPGLAINKVDAAIAYSSSHILLFRGNRIHTVSLLRTRTSINLSVRTPSYLISSRYYDLPNDLDAFFKWWPNGYIATKGNQFFRFNSLSQSSYSNQRGDMRIWGLANGIDGGVRYSNGLTYVFKGTQYYRLREVSIRGNSGGVISGGYPRNTASPWYGCS